MQVADQHPTAARRDTERSPRARYLFIRILEACNADCFMCEYALSRDTYRFSTDDFAALLPSAWDQNVRYVRFTGGEPLMHRDVLGLVRMGAARGMRMSIITNGMLLPRMAPALAEAGLAQVVVSIDGASAATHDLYRASSGMFDNAVEGLRALRRLGVRTRVNTVVGPHNYAEMGDLQEVLTEVGVQQWELSSLKLDREIQYPDPDSVRATCDPIYAQDPATTLVPLGKRFYGDTPAEQELYFQRSITPRASEPLCHVVDDVIYIDGRNGRTFACSCLPHRPHDDGGGAPVQDQEPVLLGSPRFRNAEPEAIAIDGPKLRQHADYFRTEGPRSCTGCSTTAAGYSNDVAKFGEVPDWHY